MSFNSNRKSKKPFFKNGKNYYPRLRDAEKRKSRRDERICFSKRMKAYYIKRSK